MATHLERILSAVREELEARKAADPFADVAARAKRNVQRRGLRRGPWEPPGIIAEIKRASPSRGWIRKDLDAAETARAYVRGGACAVSVLTEGRFFGGSLADLSAASAACGDVPALRKDFLLDDYMIAESRAHGADLVLLIVAVLGKETGRMLRSAREFGMEALVEVHDEAEMELAAEAGASVIGINNRSLATLKVDLDTSRRLLPLAPGGAMKVVESGIASPEEVRRLHAMGADAFLVGEALVRAGDPEEAVRTIREKSSRRTA
ncbi:MAG: indole-3-glycerol phosphate synthase TrpC [Deltaproteobacteria bacterium]|nr:indole-3-glycerol phosphate synthase TrpC [Deltaproteobacteria bacterium]PWB60803.1 MAG: indole-3-glycerol phosphate synthase TrpC [Deltaproteobacteria bacterium]